MGMILDIAETIASVLAVLYALIFIHEGGHYLALRHYGIPVEKLSIGFFPFISFKLGRTRLQVGWLPLGGYNKPTKAQSRSMSFYGDTSLRGSLVISSAGIAANYLAGYLLFLASALAAGLGWQSVYAAARICWDMTVGFVPFLLTELHIHSSQAGSSTVDSIANSGSNLALILLAIGGFSIALGLFNLLPVPALDGGKCVIGLIEHTRRRALSQTTMIILGASSLGLIIAYYVISWLPQP